MIISLGILMIIPGTVTNNLVGGSDALQWRALPQPMLMPKVVVLPLPPNRMQPPAPPHRLSLELGPSPMLGPDLPLHPCLHSQLP